MNKTTNDPWDLGTGNDPSGNDGGAGSPKGTDSAGSQPSGSGEARPASVADQGIPLPLIYGTARAPVLVIEKNQPINVQPPAWKPSTAYVVDQWVSNYGQAYKCVAGGTSGSASGPTVSSGTQTEAGGPTWTFRGAYKTWASQTAYVVGDFLVHGGSPGSFQYLYWTTTGGTSERASLNMGGGPRGAADYVDGSVTWTWLGVVAPWNPSTEYTSLSSIKTIPNHWVTNVGNLYECTTSGTSGSTSSGPSTKTPLTVSDGTAQWVWQQALPCFVWQQSFVGALCEGQATSISRLWWDKERITSGARTLTLGTGPDASGQTIPAVFDSSGYQHTALVYSTNAITGTQQELPAIAVEVNGVQFGGGTADVSPADILTDLWTHTRRGLALSSALLDTSIGGGGGATWRTYCDAAGFRFSMLIDTQRTVMSILSDLLLATNSECVWSGGKLKVVPLADQSITAPTYGATNFVPSVTADYSLGLGDFLDQTEPVRVERRSDADCFNSWPVQYVDRAFDYTALVHEDPDATDVDARGRLKRASTTALPVIFPDGTQAMALSRNLAQRSLNVRNRYSFRLSWRHVLTEPTSIVTLTEPSIGLVNVPVRIVEWSENEDFTISVVAEDYPAGVAAAGGYQPQQGDGYKANESASLAGVPTVISSTTTGVGAGTVGAPSLQNGAVGSAQTSPGVTNTDNLWPNPSSEAAPPPGADTSAPVYTGNVLRSGSAEWAHRAASGSAYAGGYVRKLAILDPGTMLQLEHRIPCAPGDSFYFEARARFISGGAGCIAEVQMLFLDAVGSVVGSAAFQDTSSSSWTLISCSGTAPAGAVAVTFQLNADDSAGIGTGYAEFDAIYARRKADLKIISPDVLQTSNYTESAGAPTAGAKLDSNGVALKVVSNGLQIGKIDLTTHSAFTGFSAIAYVSVTSGTSSANLRQYTGGGIDLADYQAAYVNWGSKDVFRVRVPAATVAKWSSFSGFVGAFVQAVGTTATPARFVRFVEMTTDGSGNKFFVFGAWDTAGAKQSIPTDDYLVQLWVPGATPW